MDLFEDIDHLARYMTEEDQQAVFEMVVAHNHGNKKIGRRTGLLIRINNNGKFRIKWDNGDPESVVGWCEFLRVEDVEKLEKIFEECGKRFAEKYDEEDDSFLDIEDEDDEDGELFGDYEDEEDEIELLNKSPIKIDLYVDDSLQNWASNQISEILADLDLTQLIKTTANRICEDTIVHFAEILKENKSEDYRHGVKEVIEFLEKFVLETKEIIG